MRVCVLFLQTLFPPQHLIFPPQALQLIPLMPIILHHLIGSAKYVLDHVIPTPIPTSSTHPSTRIPSYLPHRGQKSSLHMRFMHLHPLSMPMTLTAIVIVISTTPKCTIVAITLITLCTNFPSTMTTVVECWMLELAPMTLHRHHSAHKHKK